MNMDITSLRSLLQYVCKDLKNLTNNDLFECKFLFKKLIFYELFKSISSLSDEYNHLLDLIDRYNHEISLYKNGNNNLSNRNTSKIRINNDKSNNYDNYNNTISTSPMNQKATSSSSTSSKAISITKEQRIEIENIFRSNFLKIILTGLTKLSWPPSLIPFSDPLNDLFNDNTIVLSAMEYLAKISASCNNVNYHDVIITSKKNNGNSSNITVNTSTSNIDISYSSGNNHKEYVNNNNTTITNISDHSIDEKINNNISMTTSTDSRALGDKSDARSSFNGIIDLNHTKNNDTNNAATNPTTTGTYNSISGEGGESNSQNQSNISSSSSSSSSSNNNGNNIQDRKIELNWHAFDILQKQNEILSVQLYELRSSIMKRDQIEAKLTGILSELKTTLAEIASIGSSSSISCDEHGSRDMKYKDDDNNTSFVRKDISLNKSRDLNSTSKNYTGVNNISSSDCSSGSMNNIDFLAEIKREEDEIKQQKMKSLGMTLLMNDDNHHKSNDKQKYNYNNSGSGIASSVLLHGRSSERAKRNSLKSTSTKDDDTSSNIRIRATLNTPPPHNRSVSFTRSTVPSIEELSRRPSSTLPSSSSSSSSSAIIWSKLYSKISSLEEQWNIHQKQSRLLAEIKSSTVGSYSPQKDFNFHTVSTHNKGSSSSRSTYRKPSMSLVSHTLGLQRQLLSSSSSNSQQQHYNINSSSSSSDSYTSMCAKNGLDLSRIHLLQRDLIQFSEKSFEWSKALLSIGSNRCSSSSTSSSSNSSSSGVDGGGSNESVDGGSSRRGSVRSSSSERKNENDRTSSNSTKSTNPTTTDARGAVNIPKLIMKDDIHAKYQQLSYELQHTSSKLLIHLSCIAPIAPLSSSLDLPFQSHLSGLQLLFNEV
jgi:hypothetical protein